MVNFDFKKFLYYHATKWQKIQDQFSTAWPLHLLFRLGKNNFKSLMNG